jgi:hypothetical protein
MIYIVLNVVPILMATVASLIFGAVYAAFARHSRFSPTVAITAFVAEFWLAAVLAGALILAPAKGSVWTMTLGSAFVIWIGFVVPVIMTSYRFRTLSIRSAMMDSFHWLGVMLIQATMLRLIGLVPPPI